MKLEPMLIAHALTTICTPIVILLLSRIIPARYLPEYDAIDEDAFHDFIPLFPQWKRRADSLFVGILAVIAMVIFMMCSLAGRIFLNSQQPYRYLLNIDLRLWEVGTAFFAGMAIAIPCLQLALRWLLKGKYPIFMYFQAVRYRLDNRKSTIILTICFILLGATYSMTLFSFTKLTDQHLIRATWFGYQQKVYDYTDIRSIKSVSSSHRPINGEAFDSPHMLLTLRDGIKINAEFDEQPLGEMHREAMVFLAAKSGLPVKTVQFDSDE